MGRPEVTDCKLLPGNSRETILALLAALELESTHPLADALLVHAACILGTSDSDLPPSASSARQFLSKYLGLAVSNLNSATGMGMDAEVSASEPAYTF